MKSFLENLSYERLIFSAIAVIAFAICFILLGNVKKKVLGTAENIKDTKNVLVRKIVTASRTLVVIFALLTVSQINGVNLGSVIAGLGILSAVVGLALQDLLKDIIMGIHIVADKFYSMGDVVEYGGKEGIVVGFSLTATKIELLDENSEITVSNRNISEIRRIKDAFLIDLPLSYEENAEKIHNISQKIAAEISEVEEIENCLFLGTQEFKDSAVIYRFKILCEPQKVYELRRKAIFVIQKELEINNIKIPFNQIDVNFKEEKQNGNQQNTKR